MLETIEWLAHIERLSSAFYREASVFFREDEPVSKFLRHLSDEEAWHLKVIESAAEFASRNAIAESSIILDAATKNSIEAPLARCVELLNKGALNRQDLLDCLAAAEFSEWNYIFIHVMDLLKKERQFMPVPSRIYHHLLEIEAFFRSLPEGEKYISSIKRLMPQWNEKILVIDDEPSILGFLKNLLNDEGTVETALNGREGLRKVTENYFDVILTDLKMPVMDGMEFYKKAAEHDPDIGRRIIFFSGMANPEHVEFFRKNNLRFLTKPSPIREILKNVHEIMNAPPDQG
ncbi:MAG: response regulator [Nitrospirae bacterium]|nr:response regulator [Nitrospirota bacterium]